MDIEALIQGGAVGISILLILILYFVLRMLFKIITNHLHDQQQSTDDLRVVINKNNTVITELVTYLKKANGK